MKRLLFLCSCSLLLVSCRTENSLSADKGNDEFQWVDYDETQELKEQAQHENERMRFKLINSKFLDKNEIWADLEDDLEDFTAQRYEQLKPLIMERSIPELQRSIRRGNLSYEELTLFYLYRIRKFESNRELSLNAIISLNPEVVEKARQFDRRGISAIAEHSLYGMPILLKDNINTLGMPTTAGAVALAENITPQDAFIVKRLKEHGALILGKVNLSEWAYYFCEGCPLGYSAVGGQTLNPYGRKEFETGGSSSGSAVAVAANYAAAAVGTETAGSILSPASANALVGLKPTVGLLSRTGIVPISGTLDTPGPITRTVIGTAILLEAMTGKDPKDPASVAGQRDYTDLQNATLQGKRIGVMNRLLDDSLYAGAVEEMRSQGAVIIPFDTPEVSLEGFSQLLSADMKRDLPAYLEQNASENIAVTSVEDVVTYNLEDTLKYAPYGQAIFKEIVADTTSEEELVALREKLQENGRRFFDIPMDAHDLDAVLSMNNYHAAHAAVAKYPAITVPAGFRASGQPANVTFIARPFQEKKLLELAHALERNYRMRKPPANYN